MEVSSPLLLHSSLLLLLQDQSGTSLGTLQEELYHESGLCRMLVPSYTLYW